MIVILMFIAGAVTGWLVARRRQGVLLDRLQYATAFGIAFGIVGLFATVVVERML